MSSEDPHIVGALIDVCRMAGVTCLVQVGAEDGYEADEIRKAIGCRAVCIEPDPKCGPCSTSIEWHEVVIGDDNSVVDFYLNAARGLSSKIPRADSLEILARMPQITLEKLCRRHEVKVDGLIIDTEGTTLEVLRGLGATLGLVKMAYVEVQHDTSRGTLGQAADVDEHMLRFGFRRSMELPTYSAGGQSNWTYTK